ncbi:peptidoglycan-binding domain-containing protein [Sphaerisporangium sp. NPDC088356]|uniref:peptidoglycan-binding domain-containing protein n=1 Tax=Sphaerisporangium sp. NPDC088356 TaxID=3154871 RepID=UPI0034255451
MKSKIALPAAALAMMAVAVVPVLATPAHANTAAKARAAGPFGCNYTNSEPVLRKGSTGTAVKQAQCLLKYRIGQPDSVDGVFGSATDSAVYEFQTRWGLKVDRVIGSSTWYALKH